MNSLDIFIQNYFSTVRTPFTTEFAYIVSRFFDVTDWEGAIAFIAMVFCIFVLIYLFRNKKYSFLFLFTLFCGAIIIYFLKMLFGVARPLDGVIIAFGQSFPSYHATMATMFFAMLMYIFDDHFNSLGRIIFNLACVVGIFLVAISRVYLGVHWLSDVIGGIVLGVLICFMATKVFKYFK
ncbi:MAG: phosphatase PAP2 family protein [Candidatus Paceibacterota bacterium]|jgi:undecaprenyl-diphosphatase